MAIKNENQPIEIISRRRFVKNAPDKIRFAAGLIKNKNLDQAMDALKFSNLAASKPLLLNLKQGLSQAKDKDMPTENLSVKIDPKASLTASEEWFSEGIISKEVFCLSVSNSISL